MLIFALAYRGRKFSFVFWENWKKRKALSKLTDLYEFTQKFTKIHKTYIVQAGEWLSIVE